VLAFSLGKSLAERGFRPQAHCHSIIKKDNCQCFVSTSKLDLKEILLFPRRPTGAGRKIP